jgi:hypothetical protein
LSRFAATPRPVAPIGLSWVIRFIAPGLSFTRRRAQEPDMNPIRISAPTIIRIASVAAVTAALCGCATQAVDAQWRDPQLAASPNFLRGARVLVACQAAELTVQQICQDRLSSEVVARGATPVLAAPQGSFAPDRPDAWLPAARSAGAKAVMLMTVGVAIADVGPASGFSFGIGGFGFGRHGGVGVGADIPVGGTRVVPGYAANGSITDASNGRLLWTAKATASPSTDINAQMGELSRAVLGAADQAGLF